MKESKRFYLIFNSFLCVFVVNFLFCFFQVLFFFRSVPNLCYIVWKNEKHFFLCFKLGIIYLIFQEFCLIFKCFLPFGKFVELKKGSLSKSSLEKFFWRFCVFLNGDLCMLYITFFKNQEETPKIFWDGSLQWKNAIFFAGRRRVINQIKTNKNNQSNSTNYSFPKK